MIETRGLELRFGHAPAGSVGLGGPTLTTHLRFADVHVPQGGVVVLRGNSGSGKSSWLALAAGIRQAFAGKITVAGTDLSSLSGRALDAWRARNIGFLPQRLHLSDALTVGQNLALAQWAAGVKDGAAIGRALGALGVAELASRLPAQLSGGQAQRVALARAVLLSPRVLLADEPTASLDDTACQAALGLLHSTAQQHGSSLVVATHDARACAFLAGLGAQMVVLGLPSGQLT